MAKNTLWIVAGVGLLGLLAYSYFKGRSSSSRNLYEPSPLTYSTPSGGEVFFSGSGDSKLDRVIVRQTGKSERWENTLDFLKDVRPRLPSGFLSGRIFGNNGAGLSSGGGLATDNRPRLTAPSMAIIRNLPMAHALKTSAKQFRTAITNRAIRRSSPAQVQEMARAQIARTAIGQSRLFNK